MDEYKFLVAEIKRLRKNPTDRCVEWPFGRNPVGYVRVTRRHKPRSVDYLAFRLFYGHKPRGPVYHDCDNPACYNPNHLYDICPNMVNRVKQGQAQTRLSKSQEHIAQWLLKSGYSRQAIAIRFGVSIGTIWNHTGDG